MSYQYNSLKHNALYRTVAIVFQIIDSIGQNHKLAEVFFGKCCACSGYVFIRRKALPYLVG